MTEYHYEYEFPVPLPGDRAAIFEALVDPHALRAWFAEHVEVEPRVGGAFRFWGRHTYGLPTSEQATQKIVALAAPDRLAFSWKLLDRDTEVTWELNDEDSDDGRITKLTVRHRFSSLPDVARPEALVDDLWRIHTGNLCFYLHGRSEAFRPDFADPSPVVRCEIVIDASPERVFAALTVPEYIK